MFSQTRSALLKVFCACVLGLVCESLLGMVLYFYILFGKLFASSFIIIALCDHTQIEATKNLIEALCLNLIFLCSFGIFAICLFLWGDDLGNLWNIPTRNKSKYFLSLDNWYYNVVKVVGHLYFGVGFICFILFQ